jgi:hypothetical protein
LAAAPCVIDFTTVSAGSPKSPPWQHGWNCRADTVWMWLKVQGAFMVSGWLASPADGCHRDDDAALVAVVCWRMGMFRERAGGAMRRTRTDGGAANPRVAVAQRDDVAGPAGVGVSTGGVVRGCDEPRVRGGGAMARGMRGLVWCRPGFAGGHVGMLGFAGAGPAGGDVVTGLSQAAWDRVGRRGTR